MTIPNDPLDALREPTRPVAPDPAFATRLRARLEALLLDPSLPITLEDSEMTDTTQTVRLRPGDLSYTALWTGDVETAARFYGAVLGWRTEGDHGGRGRRVTSVRTDTAIFGPMPSTLFFAAVVDDLDAAAYRVRAAGGSTGDVATQPFGRLLDCRDDQGLRFALHEPVPGDEPTVADGPTRAGELAYVAVQMPDTDAARAFYGSVLGWQFRPGTTPRNWHVEVDGASTRPTMVGLGEHPGEPTVVPMFAVDDVSAACDAVRAAGGNAGEPQAAGYGTTAECTDDQGGRFHIARF